ncbi:MAG: tRNA pseudouridine(55) synthase TruB [Dehalococcoidales bacterium]|nr:MAG: tRNA pseudouridine(55) synthase TruB [Dehalococcoidales bacterium]
MDGILNINKPRGKTSFSIVAAVRRLSGEKRVGHAGTLDPEATGVLPVCLGKATRIIEFLMDTTKAYRAEVELGVDTDTYDATGTVVQRGDVSGINREQVETALGSFRGRILQTPPMYSAVKQQGRPLYEIARAGKTVERKKRSVDVHSLELKTWQTPVATLEVVCGKGTYIRSLAHDLGQALGCGAMLRDLVRLRCGLFEIENSVTLPELEEAFHQGRWQEYLYSIDNVLSHWEAVTVSNETAWAIRNGQSVEIGSDAKFSKESLSALSADSHCRAYTSDGCLLALLRFEPELGRWQPDKVFQ